MSFKVKLASKVKKLAFKLKLESKVKLAEFIIKSFVTISLEFKVKLASTIISNLENTLFDSICDVTTLAIAL